MLEKNIRFVDPFEMPEEYVCPCNNGECKCSPVQSCCSCERKEYTKQLYQEINE